MEKKKIGGVHRLFVIIFFFTASILFLNSQKKTIITQTHIDGLEMPVSALPFSLDQAYHHINSLLVSHNTDLIVKFINHSMNHYATNLVEKIIVDKKFLLSDVEKMKILFGAVMYCKGKKAMQYHLLDLLLTHSDLCSSNSALLTLIRSNYSNSLPVFLNWLRDRQKDENLSNLWAFFVEQAFFMAIEHDDYDVVENMLSKKIRMSQEKASQLLWVVVEQNKNSLFIPLLVKYAQADINYVCNGKTLLIKAVEQKNKDIIQVLLDTGAVVDRVVDPEQGSALQVAMARNDKIIQDLLREYGA